MGERIDRFEDLIAWQKARSLAAVLYRTSARGALASDFALRNQMRRAAVSILSNIAEGFERTRPGEFHQFLSVADGFWAELRAQLYVALDAGYLAEDSFNDLHDRTVELGRIIGGLRAAVERRK